MLQNAQVIVSDGTLHIVELLDSDLGKKLVPVMANNIEDLNLAIAAVHLEWEERGNCNPVPCPVIEVEKIIEARAEVIEMISKSAARVLEDIDNAEKVSAEIKSEVPQGDSI